ncbi:MAG: hypothetical protein HRT35_33245 [Algicola sp.]|nr:hypothetical protein [Algicola sp.]
MNETSIPLHSKSTLLKALAGALTLAAVIFVTIVLPAEFQSDPTGTGKLLGLTVLTAPPTALTDKVPAMPTTTQAKAGETQEDVATVIVPAHRGVEYKFTMNQYAQINYEWTSEGVPLHFDFHGEPKGDTTGYFLSYTLATADEMKGAMTVPFDGVHGWYWKNTSDQPVVVTLKTSGDYQVKGLIH